MLETIQRVILVSLESTLEQTLPPLVPLLVLGWLIHLCSDLLEKSAVRLLGLKAYLYLIGWPGTLVHELGHAMFCPLFGHRITGMRLFTFSTRKQSAGYVCHSYNGRNPYHLIGNFFISIGPLVLGSAVIYLSLRYLAGLPPEANELLVSTKPLSADEGVLGLLWAFFQALKAIALKLIGCIDFSNYKFYLAGYLILSIGSAMTLSQRDIASAASGLGVILLLVFGINLMIAGFGLGAPDTAVLVRWAAAVSVILILVLVVCGLALLLLKILLLLTSR